MKLSRVTKEYTIGRSRPSYRSNAARKTCECRLPGRTLRIEIIILTLDSEMLGILQKEKSKKLKGDKYYEIQMQNF